MGFLSKLLRLLLKVTKVTTGYQKLPKMGKKNNIISSFFARRTDKASAEGRCPPQELEVGPRSGPYLLVFPLKRKMSNTWLLTSCIMVTMATSSLEVRRLSVVVLII